MLKVQEKTRNITQNQQANSKIIMVYIITIFFIAILFFPLVPLILNYPPGTVNTEFQREYSYFTYNAQYFIIVLITLLAGYLYLKSQLKYISNWELMISNKTIENIERIKLIRKKCLILPYTIYVTQIIVPNLVLFLFLISVTSFLSAIRIWILLFSFITLSAVVTHIFSRRIFIKILLSTYDNHENQGRRINLKSKIFLQLIPIIVVGILFTSLIGYSRFVKDKGDTLYELYMLKLQNCFQNIQQIADIDYANQIMKKISLKGSNDCTFIVTPSGKIVTSNNSKLSTFFIKYLNQLSPTHKGRVYDIYGVDTQGATIKIKGSTGYWTVGIKYEIASNQTVMFFMISFVVLITLNFGILYFFSKSLSDDISLVADGLNRIASGEDIDHYKKLAVTSNDEIGDLVIAFNKIQDITVENIKSIRRNQDILTERERLASLGQLIGGIAHNLKTPIMSISGGLESLVDLINEYDQSIGNLQVTNEDHHEIAKEMLRWIEDIKPHCSYMSDIITAVKGQAVKLNATTTDNFSIDELIKHIEVLMKYELIKNACELKVDMQINPDIQLQGELGSLVQVFNNLITNSIHAYDGKPGTIDFIVKKIDNYVEFIVKDYGMGIPEKVKDKLFKEMITTKAKEGTGLGLYMSYSTIRGRFSGDIRLESEQHVGTTFYITIPLSTI